MGAYAAFGQAYRLHYGFDGVELQRCQSKFLANALNHRLVFGRIGCGILLEIFVMTTLKALYHASCDELHVAFGCRKVKELARIDERRAADADVHLFSSTVKQVLHVVAQLSSAHYRVVAEYDLLVLEQSLVGNQLHLGHKLTAFLGAGCKASGPCRGIFHDTALVGDSFALGIAQSHSNSRIGHRADEIDFSVIVTTHFKS